MYEYAHDGPPGCWIVTESGAGGDPDTARRLLRVLDGAPHRRGRVVIGPWPLRQPVLDAEISPDGRWTGSLATEHRSVQLRAIRSVWYRDPARSPDRRTDHAAIADLLQGEHR